MTNIKALPDCIEGQADGIGVMAKGFQMLQDTLNDADEDLKPLADQVGRIKALTVYLQQQANLAAALAQEIVDARD